MLQKNVLSFDYCSRAPVVTTFAVYNRIRQFSLKLRVFLSPEARPTQIHIPVYTKYQVSVTPDALIEARKYVSSCDRHEGRATLHKK